jgi:hypothetical protein
VAGEVVDEPAEQGREGAEVGSRPAGGDLLQDALALMAQRLQGRQPGVGDHQTAGPAVGLVGQAPHQAVLDEGRDVPADRRGVGVDQIGQGALAQWPEADEGEQQDVGGTVAVTARHLALERMHRADESRQVVRQRPDVREAVLGVRRQVGGRHRAPLLPRRQDHCSL